MKKMNTSVSPASRVSPILLAIILVTLFLSMFSIYLGINQFASPAGDASTGSFYILMGGVTLGLCTYMLIQTRKRMLRIVTPEMQPLSTTLTCQKCGLNDTREFQRGDFVFKQTDKKCPRDNENMVISAIYREIKEKEKVKEEAYR